MVVALSNLILLLPIAGVLAIMLAMTGSMVLRPRDDSVRVFVLIIVWQFALLGLIGIMTKWTWFSLFWVALLLGFLIQLWFWERGLARNILMLVFGTSCHSNHQLHRATHYLCQEGRGYWRRLGKRFDFMWRATSSWELAFKHTGLAEPTRIRLALANLVNRQNADHFHWQVTQVTFEQTQASQWLGRLLVVSLSFLVLLVVGVYDELRLGPMRDRMWAEFSNQTLAITLPWKIIIQWKLYVFIPFAIWMVLLLLYALHKIPILARHQPFAWLLGSYYRSLALEGLADSLQSSPDPIAACNKLAEAMPIPTWSRRFQLASQNMSVGQLLPGALVNSGLLRKNEAAALTLCDDAKSIAWTLHQLGQSLLSRTFNRTHRTVQLLAVVLPIGAALMITMYALTTFGMLTALMEAQL